MMVSSGRRRILAICRYAVATADMSLKRKERCEQILSKDKGISRLAAGAKGEKTEQLDCRHKTDKVTKINEHAAEPETFLWIDQWFKCLTMLTIGYTLQWAWTGPVNEQT